MGQPLSYLGRIRIPEPPEALRTPCKAPIELVSDRRDGGMSTGAVERAFAADRIALMECGEKLKYLTDYYRSISAILAGEEVPSSTKDGDTPAANRASGP